MRSQSRHRPGITSNGRRKAPHVARIARDAPCRRRMSRRRSRGWESSRPSRCVDVAARARARASIAPVSNFRQLGVPTFFPPSIDRCPFARTDDPSLPRSPRAAIGVRCRAMGRCARHLHGTPMPPRARDARRRREGAEAAARRRAGETARSGGQTRVVIDGSIAPVRPAAARRQARARRPTAAPRTAILGTRAEGPGRREHHSCAPQIIPQTESPQARLVRRSQTDPILQRRRGHVPGAQSREQPGSRRRHGATRDEEPRRVVPERG